MPHDIEGKELKPGDIVTIRFKVKEVHSTEEYCNVNLETEQVMYPSDNRSAFTANTKQCQKV